MGKARKWMSIVRKKFLIIHPHPQETVIVLHTNITQEISSSNTHHNNITDQDDHAHISPAIIISGELIKEAAASNERYQLMTTAAIKIQACFRSHLARRAFRALRSLVKLQALVRGVLVRRQARMAIHCMHVLARLHITVRARQIFT
ncbi:protein IQ-DOMAIN 20-like [Impatiens glandulifera]|uniref:protein IQ-DOMAIN 20-like n=1 Tax=Impatiens glandulifera TaxID=253017 RepID=UPI001FB147CB|nr:protein IQ-DOMAIN 20-like [Impatiens glandulifera]